MANRLTLMLVFLNPLSAMPCDVVCENGADLGAISHTRPTDDKEAKDFSNSVGMKMLRVPKGQFEMGAPPSEPGYRKDEKRHTVTLSQDFFLGMYPVTQEEYGRVMGSNPSRFKGPRHPVEQVSWADAVEFCRRMSELPAEKAAGRVYRLPTEAEWEYACRAGTTTPLNIPDEEIGIEEVAWFERNSGGQTCQVGQKLPNSWGFYDMHGNVWEWCEDWYADHSDDPVTDPTGPPKGDEKVSRGGSWLYAATRSRSASRMGSDPNFRSFTRGFRVAMSVNPQRDE